MAGWGADTELAAFCRELGSALFPLDEEGYFKLHSTMMLQYDLFAREGGDAEAIRVTADLPS